jgi:hypothetical protein
MELFSYTRFESNDSPTHPSERIAARMLGTTNGRTAVQQHPPARGKQFCPSVQVACSSIGTVFELP